MAPKSPTGEMLAYVRENSPHLFETSVEEQLGLLEAASGAGAETAGGEAAGEEGEAASTDIALYRRMEEVRRAERSRAVADVLYQSILYKFDALGAPLLNKAALEEAPGLRGTSLEALTTGVHSAEALDMVRTHLMSLLGPQMPQSEYAMQTTAVRISKLQAAQVYAASVMFGYFLRRVDKRFQMEKQFGTFKKSTDETVAMLEELFARSKSLDELDGEDSAGLSDRDGGEGEGEGVKGEPTLQEYVESFDRQTLAETAKVVSTEGVALLQEYTNSLFGSVQDLQTEMQNVMEGKEFDSQEKMFEAMQAALEGDEIQALTLTFADQRRVILEAVAFGSFLRDTEAYVEVSHTSLLTPAPSGPGGPGAPPPPPAALT